MAIVIVEGFVSVAWPYGLMKIRKTNEKKINKRKKICMITTHSIYDIYNIERVDTERKQCK